MSNLAVPDPTPKEPEVLRPEYIRFPDHDGVEDDYMAGEWYKLRWVYRPKSGWTLHSVSPVPVYFGSDGQSWTGQRVWVSSTPYGSTDWFSKYFDMYRRANQRRKRHESDWEDLYKIAEEIKSHVWPGYGTASAAGTQQEHKEPPQYYEGAPPGEYSITYEEAKRKFGWYERFYEKYMDPEEFRRHYQADFQSDDPE